MTAVLLMAAGVVALNLYALALVLLRAPVYRVPLYRPMVLNLALSAAPALVLAATLAIEVAVDARASSPVPWIILVIGAVVWLLLLPNSAYLITELNFTHRREGEVVPLWFDIVATLALAMSGVLNALVNVFVVQMLVVAIWYEDDAAPFTRADSWLVVAAVLVLVSFGIYLGRHIRFNSWDLARPMRFARLLVAHFAAPGRVTEAVGFCVVHTLLLGILYAVVALPLAVSV